MITDHIVLEWLHNLKYPTGCLARWALELLKYDYKIIYGKGSLNYAPDALSRMSKKLDSVPKELRHQVLGENHIWKHARIAGNYFWPGIYSETLKYVKECNTFQRNKLRISNQIGPMERLIIQEA